MLQIFIEKSTLESLVQYRSIFLEQYTYVYNNIYTYTYGYELR